MKHYNIQYEISSISDKVFSEKLRSEDKFKTFLTIVEVSHKIDINYFEIFYLNQKIGKKYYSLSLREITKNNNEPFFTIKQISNSLLNSSDKKNMSLGNSIKNSTVEIKIANCPSKDELTKKIDNFFCEESKYSNKTEDKCYSINSNELNNDMTVNVNGVNKGMDLFSKLNSFKSKNQNYINMGLNMKIVNNSDSFKNTESNNKQNLIVSPKDKAKVWEKTSFYNRLLVRLLYLYSFYYNNYNFKY